MVCCSDIVTTEGSTLFGARHAFPLPFGSALGYLVSRTEQFNIPLISFEMQGPNDKGKHSQTQTARMTTARQHLHRLPNQVNHGQICTTGPCLSQDEGGPLYFEKVT